jgi:hypothetical protein
MSADEEGDADEIGECGYCHEIKPLVAEMEISASRSGEKIATSQTVNLCDECIPKVVEEFRRQGAASDTQETPNG